MAASPTHSHDEKDAARELDGKTERFDQEEHVSFADYAEYRACLNRLWWRIIPYFSLLYLLSFLDRVNIGQARLAGLEKDLGLVGTDYQTALAVFFASYVAFEIPASLLLKLIRPHVFVSITMILWAICSTLMALSKDAGDLIAIRFILGIFESGLFPGLNFVLSMWLPSSALGVAVSVFFAGATLSGALGGLLAFGIRQMAGIAGLGGWAWIFLLEGILTFVCALPAWWLVPDFPTTPNQRIFKSEEQRKKWLNHLSRSQGINAAHTPFAWRQVKRALADPMAWLFAVMYLSIAQPFYSLSLFVPSIIAGLGYTNAAANGISAAPYVLGFITTVGTGLYSDRIRTRGIFIVGWMSIVVIAYIVLICPVSNAAKLAMVFLAVGGVSPCIALSITWVGQQYGPVYKRATGMGLHFTFGNSAGIISSFVYPAAEGPRYIKGHAIALAFGALAIVCALLISFLNRRENARRDAKYGKPAADGSETTMQKLLDPQEMHRWHLEGKSREEILDLGDSHPAYRYLC